jgi:hypothetical protein
MCDIEHVIKEMSRSISIISVIFSLVCVFFFFFFGHMNLKLTNMYFICALKLYYNFWT